MILNIAAALCTGILFLLSNSLSDAKVASKDSNIRAGTVGVTRETWYQDEAFLQVIDGTFTVELVSNDSAPKSLNAETRGIIRLNSGFARIPSLERLSLEDNSINEIESSVFKGLPQLVYLNLGRNRIYRIAEDGFKGLTKLQVLILDRNSNTFRMEFSIATRTLPALMHFSMNRNGLQIIDMNNKDRSLICNSNLKHLYLSSNSLTTFDLRSSGDTLHTLCLPNLTHLYLDGNRLATVFLDGMPLQALSLNRNSLREIPKVNSELKLLSMESNFVTDVTNLRDAENLVHLILSRNSFGNNLKFPVQFQNFSFLEQIALDGNNIPYLPDGCFYNLPSLRLLYLHDNRINNVYPKAFAKLPALEELSFENNRLKSFPGGESFGESNLTRLDFTNNKIKDIGDLEAHMIPELKVLRITGNLVKTVETRSLPSDTTVIL